VTDHGRDRVGEDVNGGDQGMGGCEPGGKSHGRDEGKSLAVMKSRNQAVSGGEPVGIDDVTLFAHTHIAIIPLHHPFFPYLLRLYLYVFTRSINVSHLMRRKKMCYQYRGRASAERMLSREIRCLWGEVRVGVVIAEHWRRTRWKRDRTGSSVRHQ
jgi:hypothetical protein